MAEAKIKEPIFGLIQSYLWDGIAHCKKDFLKTAMTLTVGPDGDKEEVLIRLMWYGRSSPTGLDISGEWRVSFAEVVMSQNLEDQFSHYGFRIGREVERILAEWVVDSGTNAWFYSRSHGFMEHFAASLQKTTHGFTVGFIEHIDPYNPMEALRIDIKWAEARNGFGDLATWRIITWTDVVFNKDNMEGYFKALGEDVSKQMWGAVNDQA